MGHALARLSASVASCRQCREAPIGAPLPHQPRPVVRLSAIARIAICGQAPGTRVHASGIPFDDASGRRLRAWLSVTPEEFYDIAQFAIVPMGFCFPGQNARGADLPPRRECALRWRAEVFAHMPQLEVFVLVGRSAQLWHLGSAVKSTLTETVAAWRTYAAPSEGNRRYVPLPHPSWRNNGWLRANPWFEEELLPELRARIRLYMTQGTQQLK